MTARTEMRILIVDDNPAIHADFRKVLGPADATTVPLDAMEAALFGTSSEPVARLSAFELVSAMQGEQALQAVIDANRDERPFALAFVDMRMPPGWDGLHTIEKIWQVDPHIQIVICSAYSDHSWSDIRARLGTCESLLILKKPFDAIEVVQCAHALTTKWKLARQNRAHVEDLETIVAARTHDLRQANERLAEQLRELERMEIELRLAQKLEAVGQLAAGVAHEINTPIQYVGDNLTFLRESTADLVTMTNTILEIAAAARTEATSALVDRIVEVATTADLAYLSAEIPVSLETITSGVSRVARIVSAMKELAHPGPREASAIDVARVLRNALEVTASSYRTVADVETSFGKVPPVVCFGSELSQVFLNLIINAAQAMADVPRRRGTLGITTRVDGSDLVVAVSDTGCGIPEANRERIFDSFFTTKEIGRGTGQGLAISRSIIVDRHGGTLSFESTTGVGTTFFVRIPIAGPAPKLRAAA